MATNYEQPGEVIDWVNGSGSAVSSGDVVVIGAVLGVALTDIASTATGSVAVKGVFTVPKVSAAVIAQGEALTYDVSVAKFDDNAASAGTGDITGAACYAFEASAATVTALKVAFTGVPGTVN